MVKKSCNWVDNTCQFEKSAISRALNEQDRQLGEPGCFATGLRGTITMWPEARRTFTAEVIQLASTISHAGLLVNIGDFVVVHDKVYKVLACVDADGLHYLIAATYARLGVDATCCQMEGLWCKCCIGAAQLH